VITFPKSEIKNKRNLLINLKKGNPILGEALPPPGEAGKTSSSVQDGYSGG